MIRDLDRDISFIREKLEETSSALQSIDKDLAVYKTLFEEHIKQDEKLYSEFVRMNDILQENTNSLKEHMYRTELAEKQLSLLRSIVENIDNRLLPIEKTQIEKEAVNKYLSGRIAKIAKIAAIVSAVAATLVSLAKLYSG